MLPTVNDTETVIQQFKVVNEADLQSRTYQMHLEDELVSGMVDGLAAMKQAIFKILQTERYQYKNIYSNNYGVEFWSLYGKSVVYAIPEIKRRITEALTWDRRITSVDSFEFETSKNSVLVKFTAHTKFGDVTIDDLSVEI